MSGDDEDDPTDEVGHGTTVHGVIAASGADGGILGVNWGNVSGCSLNNAADLHAGSSHAVAPPWLRWCCCLSPALPAARRPQHVWLPHLSHASSPGLLLPAPPCPPCPPHLQINILPCKFMSADGWGKTSDAIQCMDWCLEQKAEIISASWSCGELSNPPLEEAGACSEEWWEKGGRRHAVSGVQRQRQTRPLGIAIHTAFMLAAPPLLTLTPRPPRLPVLQWHAPSRRGRCW